ncbi:dihydroorotate dehydrogenase [uncultured Brevibacillus sp.]|uniref:dihydroorotate dehydrogenase n=1 Tax=uncultured Brevibacillus sp. TaxID=169970 RepID=UPI002591EC67|nr:dihydroorotate dehydrogenase [uncultured Brevibacillus sp.]
MPDWSYQTLFRPLLFLLPAKQARSLTLSAIGMLGKIPGGSLIIEIMGHMKPPASLSRPLATLSLTSPVGLGAGLDTDLKATEALSRFGFGYIEIGPVTLQPRSDSEVVWRDPVSQAIYYSEAVANPGMDKYVERLQNMRQLDVPIGARLGFPRFANVQDTTAERTELIERLEPYCSFFTLDTFSHESHPYEDLDGWHQHLATLRGVTDHPILLVIPPDLPEQEALGLLTVAHTAGLDGLVIAGGIKHQIERVHQETTRLTGAPSFEDALQMCRIIRSKWPDAMIIGSGGIQQPADALAFLDAGANFVQLHSGLVYSGPGLPKRINEAIWQASCAQTTPDWMSSVLPTRTKRLLFPAWVWGILLGIGMLIGGGLAWWIAATSVMLPYDERFLGARATELELVNAQLLSFMSHDRISLAGTMLSIGVIYFQLSHHGLKHGLHWARTVIRASGAVGFASFFLFVGYGYFDYMHAILALLLFPLFLLAIREPANNQLLPLPIDLTNNRDWKNALWGQLLFVIIGCGLTGAGIIISIIGVTGVFVPSDLVFLCASAEALEAYNERLIPLIAHDRAGFGGALVSDGIAVLLISLWGFRRGASWVWWTLLLAGIPGFVSGIGIHFAVGYVDFLHLFPAYVAALLFWIGLVLARPYLVEKSNG